MRECPFPQSLWVRGTLPGAVVSLIDDMRKGNARALESAGMIAKVHQEIRIRRQGFKDRRQLLFERNPRACIDHGFLVADNTRLPGMSVGHKDEAQKTCTNR